MKTKLTFIFILFIAFASGSAMARGGHGGGGHGGGARFSFFVGAPLFGLGYYPYYAPYNAYPSYGYADPNYGYPPVAAAPYAPQTYAEQGYTAPPQQAPAQAQGNWWYYCADSKAYYPYVSECSTAWEHVSPQPPSR
jgi:hypothetical protein